MVTSPSSQVSRNKRVSTAVMSRRKRDPLVGGDKESVWSKIADEMIEDEGTRALDIPSKLFRRSSIENEHRWRRAVYAANVAQHPFAMK